MKRIIDKLEEININHLSWDDLACGDETHRMLSTGMGKNKIYSCRTGVMTKIGDIEQSVWLQAVELMIIKYDEFWLKEALCEWFKKESWLKNKKELNQYACELISVRIFDNQKWIYYKAFNQKYRPQVLDKQEE